MLRWRIPFSWVGGSLGGIRKPEFGPCEVPREDIPSIDPPDDLNWLPSLHPNVEQDSLPFRPKLKDRQKNALNARMLMGEARNLGLVLPKAFTQLIRSELLQDRFGLCGDYFVVPRKFVPAPFDLGGHLIAFLSDQQSCVVWFLHFPQNGQPYVLASDLVERDERIYFLDNLPENDAGVVEEAFATTRIVANSFPEFIYRYWIEGSITAKRKNDMELSEEELAYLAKVPS